MSLDGSVTIKFSCSLDELRQIMETEDERGQVLLPARFSFGFPGPWDVLETRERLATDDAEMTVRRTVKISDEGADSIGHAAADHIEWQHIGFGPEVIR